MKLLDISLPTANSLFGLSNIALIIGGILVLMGSVGVFWSGAIKERYAEERASGNEAETAKAMAESARANESNTRLKLELEKERNERLRLEKKIAPRTISVRQQKKLSTQFSSMGWEKAEIIWHGAGEPEAFARQFAAAFEKAGIETSVHTLGPFIPSAWGLMVIKTTNDVSQVLKGFLDKAGIQSDFAETNDTLGNKQHPTIFVGIRED